MHPMDGFDLDDFLPYQLAVVAEAMSRDFSRLYRDRFGISVPEWRVIAHLSQEGRVSVREIVRRVGMEKSKVSRAASRLETAGYVSKRVNTGDRRLVELELTGKGRALVAEIVPIARAFETEMLDRLGPDAPVFKSVLHDLAARG